MTGLRILVRALVLLALVSQPAAGARRTQNVILVTIDGLRWQEVFHGAEDKLINKEAGGVRDPVGVRQRFAVGANVERRAKLMPFIWKVVAEQGQVFGDPAQECDVTVTNGLYFSYPGYNEILCGRADKRIDSNAKRDNPNRTVLEWLHAKPAYQGRVAAFASWDVFPFILNQRRSGIYVNAGWQPLEHFRNAAAADKLNALAVELPHYWDNVRYDLFTFRGALEYLHTRHPRVLYLALGETDDWAHAGRYDLYLDAARRSDDYLQQLWRTVQQLPQYRDKTSLVITTDHGRGDTREGWKSHGVDYPGCDRIWMAVLGPDTPALGVRRNLKATQSQTAATVASLVGEDYPAIDRRIAAPLPGILKRAE